MFLKKYHANPSAKIDATGTNQKNNGNVAINNPPLI
jgi:hypothetical protein